MRGRERVMRRNPAACGQIVLKHRKINDPDGIEGCRTIDLLPALWIGLGHYALGNPEGAVALSILFGQLGPEVPRSPVYVDLAFAQSPRKLGVARLDVMGRIAGHDDHEVSLGRSRQLPHLRRSLGEALRQP